MVNLFKFNICCTAEYFSFNFTFQLSPPAAREMLELFNLLQIDPQNVIFEAGYTAEGPVTSTALLQTTDVLSDELCSRATVTQPVTVGSSSRQPGSAAPLSPQLKLDPVVPVPVPAMVSEVIMGADHNTYQRTLPGSADTMTPGVIIPDTPQLKETNKNRRSTSKCCSICGKYIVNSLKLAQHMYKAHPKVPNKFKCSLCNSSFPYKFILDKHIKRTHSNNVFKCKLCNREFGRKDNYKRHLSTHKGK